MTAKKTKVQTNGKTVTVDARSDFKALPDERLIPIDAKPVLRWAALLSLKEDIDFVIEASQNYLRLQGEENEVIKRGLWIAAIVSYGRCFNQSDGRKVKIGAEPSLRAAPDNLKNRHDKTISMRNNYIAHAGEDIGEQIHAVAVKPPAPDETVLRVGPFVARATLPLDADMNELMETCKYHLTWIAKKIEIAKSKTAEWAKSENSKLRTSSLGHGGYPGAKD